MKFENKYKNIPVFWAGDEMRIFTQDLNRYYVMGIGGDRKNHLVRKNSVVKNNKDIFVGEGVCGTKTKFKLAGERGNLCKKCLEIVNEEQKGILFDEKKGEWYNPKE